MDFIVIFSYILVVSATVLFSFQFLFNQRYQENNGTGLGPTLDFTFHSNAAVVLIMLCLSGFQVEIFPFSILISAVYACNNVLMTYFSMKAFGITNLSVYSVFTMLGGMFLPFLQGVLFYDEGLGWAKLLCCAAITVAVILTASKEKSDKKAILYYAMIFVANGLSGVIARIHQSSSLPHTDSTGFSLWTALFSIFMALILSYVTRNRITRIQKRDLNYVIGYGLFCGTGNLFLLIAMNNLPSSVQYPIVTGGVMALSTVISIARKEKVSGRSKLAAAIAFIASVLMAF